MKTESNMVLSTQEYKVVGTRPVRHDGLDKVTGRARFGADLQMPGLLHGKVLRSPHAHARIKSIDASRALALPGVRAVITAADLPEPSARFEDQVEGTLFNYGFYSRNVLAREKVLYRGHALAAVAATSIHLAEEALEFIDVEYEVLPGVFDAYDAMKDGVPILHEKLLTLSNPAFRSGAYGDKENEKGTNVANSFEFSVGDIASGFDEADVVVEREFHTRAVHQGYIEPHAATALWSSDGALTIWCSTQGQFGVRDHVAKILDIPVSKMKVIPMEIGGGFGGKGQGGAFLEPLAAVLSRKTGRPVQLAMTRSEVFEGTGPTAATHIQVKMGSTREGHITAAEATLIFEAGAFPGSPLPSACRTMFAPYVIANARIQGIDVVVNTQKSGAYRAPGSPSAAFAVESLVDELSQALGIDPIEFRLMNASQEGTRPVIGPPFRRIGNVETLEAAKQHPHYSSPLDGPKRGRGVASGFWFNAGGPASAVASVNPDGTVSLVGGSPDIGGTRAVMAMHLAEVLGIAAEDVKPSIGDTDSIGYSTGAGGSSVAFKMGTACHDAAQDIKRQMIARAARIWDVGVEDVTYDDAVLRHARDPELRMSFQELAGRLNATGGPIVGRATVQPSGVGNAFALHMVDVEVDPETGKVEILRYTAFQDAGKAIHPGYVEGQMQGGAVQGIGWALNEEYVFDSEGRMMNPTFLDYRMPITLDVPMIDTVIIEVPNPGHPFGARGVGEVSLVPPMAAIANAIQNAIGVRFNRLPMSPPRILEALRAAD